MAKSPAKAPPRVPPAGPDLPDGVPYTLYFPRRGGYSAADMEYASPLPRVGDTIEYIDPGNQSRWYEVRRVVHSFQSPPGTGEEIRLLRAGIPAVYLARGRRPPGGGR